MQRKTIYDHIAENRNKTILLILAFPIALILIIFSLFLISLLFSNTPFKEALQQTATVTSGIIPIITGIAFIWILISYFFGGKILLKSANAKEIKKQDNPEIYRLVENLSIAAGLPTPKVYIINDDSLNAFATGRNPEHSIVALTKGIINKLEKPELEGVIAHEMAHIGNKDIRLMLITIAGIGFFSFLGEALIRAAARSGRGNNKKNGAAGILFLTGLACVIFGYVIAPLLRLALSRRREYQADATGAYITRNPRALARALTKISNDARVETLDKRPTMAAMCIEMPLKKKSGIFASLTGLYNTHPDVNLRIKALLDMGSELK